MTNERTKKPYKSHLPKETIARAKEMRENGTSYQKITNSLGVASSTLYRVLNPESRERDRIRNKKWRRDNKEYIKGYSREWRKNNKVHIVEYRKTHKVEQARHSREWSRDHPEYIKGWRKDHPEYKREWLKDHPEYNREWRKNNPEYNKEWCRDHKAERNAHGAKRRALERNATIGDLDEIDEIYRQAAEDPGPYYCYICGELIDIGDRHVDHVFPVSNGGAHASFNLSMTHSRCNERKGAKPPDDIDIYDRTVVDHARKGNNLVPFYNLLKLIILSSCNSQSNVI